ncbi:MAG: hypothetical protein ABWX96_02155 [Propionibacteriaceae bacterium]
MQTFASLGVAVLLIAFITFRQTRWQPVRAAKLLRMPLIFAVIGLLLVSQSARQLPAGWHLDALDAGVIGFELLVAVVVGWWMGRLTQIRTIDGVVSSRLTGPGVGVWLGFIALRIGLGILASALSAPLAALPATILFVVAAIKIVQAVVIRERVARHRAAERESARPYVGADLR